MDESEEENGILVIDSDSDLDYARVTNELTYLLIVMLGDLVHIEVFC